LYPYNHSNLVEKVCTLFKVFQLFQPVCDDCTTLKKNIPCAGLFYAYYLFLLLKVQERRTCIMKINQVEIKETLCITVEIEAESEQQVEEKVRRV